MADFQVRDLVKYGINKGNYKMKTLVFLLSIVMVPVCHATHRDTNSVIQKLYVYTQFGSGDVQVIPEVKATNCTAGYWLSPEDPGYQATLGMLVSAYHSKTVVLLSGDDQQIWSGSGSPHCRLVAVGLI